MAIMWHLAEREGDEKGVCNGSQGDFCRKNPAGDRHPLAFHHGVALRLHAVGRFTGNLVSN